MKIILGTAHLESTPGKCSPDKKFREYKYSREIVDIIKNVLKTQGYDVYVDIPENDLKLTQNQELQKRVNYVNSLCDKYGKDNCIYISIHVNGAGSEGKWMTAGGWSAFTSVGKTKADDLAECLYDAAKANLDEYSNIMDKGKLTGDYGKNQVYIRTDLSDGDRDYESGLYVLKNTKCPAVLTENLFQDNKKDVEFLLSDAGIHAITRLHIEGILNYINR